MLEFRLKKEFRNKKIRLVDRQMLEPQEVLLDDIVRKRTEEEGIDDKKLEVPLSKRAFYGLSFFSIFFISLLLARSFHLQVIRGEEYFSLAERNRFAFLSLQADRGVIYDRNYNQLVFNRPTFKLVYTKNGDGFNEDEARAISELIGLDLEELKEKVENSDLEKVVVVSDVDQIKTVILESRIGDFVSFEVERSSTREYKDGKLFSHIIGYTGRISPEEKAALGSEYSINDFIGKSGIEKYYESYLRLKSGTVRVERDARGHYKSEELVSESEPGDNLALWVDAELQEKLNEELERITYQVGSQKAAAVALDPKTGGVLSMVSIPGYDNNAFSGRADSSEITKVLNDPLNPLFNRAIAGGYPAGSTIKPIIGLAALEEKIVDAGKQFFSAGFLSIPNPWNPTLPTVFADNKVHGWVDLRRAIAVSSNIYFYIVGGGYENQKGLGGTLMKKYLDLFGWNSRTEIDLPGETEGFTPYPDWKKENLGDNWRIGDNYNMSIGQGYISVSPLQIATSFAAIANGGRLIEPRVVKEIVDSDGNIIERIEGPTLREEFVDKKNLEIVRQGMRDAVLYGSAATLNSLPVASAAKTGTAQIPKQGYYHNWVTVFAPYENPEIVLVIIIEEVKGVRAATLPVAKEVLEWYFNKNNR